MGELQKGLNKTILLVTHDPRAADAPARRHLEKGRLVEGTPSTAIRAVPVGSAAPGQETGVRPV